MNRTIYFPTKKGVSRQKPAKKRASRKIARHADGKFKSRLFDFKQWVSISLATLLLVTPIAAWVHSNLLEVDANNLEFVSPVPVPTPSTSSFGILEVDEDEAGQLHKDVGVAVRSEEVVAPTPTPTPQDKEPCNEKCQILKLIVDKFGDHAADAITMIRKCENSSLNPRTINKANRNGTWDVGVFQVNVNPADQAEVERLQDPAYNIEKAYKKFKAKDNTLYYWTCGHVVGHYTYVDYLQGR